MPNNPNIRVPSTENRNGVKALGVVALSTLAAVVIGIGSTGKGSGSIEECPGSEYYRDHAPVPSKTFDELQRDVNAVPQGVLRSAGVDPSDIDKRSEVFCSGNGGELFLSSDAELAISKLAAAGADLLFFEPR